MYVILFCFLITSFIFIVFGKSFLFYIAKNENYKIIDSFFIGLCLVGSILNIWSLFLPLNIFSLVFLILGSLVLFYINSNYFYKFFKKSYSQLKSQKIFSFLILCSLLIVLFYSIVTPRLYDSYLYHINAIQWNEMYSVVPGLANFHNRFGFNSSMFVISATFSFEAIYNQQLFIISSLTTFVFIVWLLKQIYFKKGVIGLFSMVFLYYFIQQFTFDISSPGTDLLPNILVSYFLLSLLFEKDSLEKKYLLYVIIPLFCITLKLSTFPIVIIGLIAVYLKNKNIFITSKQLVLYGLLLVFPWIIRNIIISGYLIFPLDSFDFFSFNWKVPKSSLIEIKSMIYSWGRLPSRGDYQEVLNMSFKEWFPFWWEVALLKNKFFIILAGLAPVFLGIFVFFNRKEKIQSYLLVIIISYFSILLWLFTAPDIRFAFAFILILALFPLFLLNDIIDKIKLVLNPLLLIFSLYVLFLIGQDGYLLFSKYYSVENVSEYIYLPKDVYDVKNKKNVKFTNHFYKTPKGKEIELFEPATKGTQCYDKFPCTPYLNNKFRLRGESLQDGFKSIEQ